MSANIIYQFTTATNGETWERNAAINILNDILNFDRVGKAFQFYVSDEQKKQLLKDTENHIKRCHKSHIEREEYLKMMHDNPEKPFA